MKIRKNLIFSILCIIVPAGVVFAQDTNTEQLSGLIEQALNNNPMLKAENYKYEAAEEAVPGAGALPDPQFTFGLMNMPVNSFEFNQEPMTGKLVSVVQMFPFPGKLGLATDIAEYNAKIARYKSLETRNYIITRVKTVYYNLYTIDRAIETVKTNREFMRQFVTIAETKYTTGTGLQQDVLRSQLELSKLEDDLILWGQKRKAAEALLNSLLNRDPDTPVPVTAKEIVFYNEYVTELNNINIEQTRPLARVWQEMLNKAESSIKLAKKDYWPNFTLGASYSQRDNLKSGMVMYDFFSATVSLNVPLYMGRKQKTKVREKEINRNSVYSEYENIINQIKADKTSILAELDMTKKRIQLYEGGILLQAQQSLDAAVTGYQVNKVDFLTLINNWTMLQNYQLQLYKAYADYRKSLAEFEQIVGRVGIQ
ncbi:TolC family protein [candidate division KSB1 bacterium]|nr:TolC family protein [candidate division KSB1 bacterium]